MPRDGSLGTTWTLPAFDDSGWISGTTGVGYERASGYESLLGLDLLSASLPPAQRMDRDGDGLNENNSVFVRVPFVLSNPSSLNTLTLRMRHDDGFAAYLNGQRVASDNEPPVLAWNSSAASDYGDVTDVMMAIVYGLGNSITIYRNGQVYADAAHATFGTLQTYPANVADVLIGKRHNDLSDGGTAAGIDGFLAGRSMRLASTARRSVRRTFSNFTPSARLVAPIRPRRPPRRTCSTCGRSMTVPLVTWSASPTARCSTAPRSRRGAWCWTASTITCAPPHPHQPQCADPRGLGGPGQPCAAGGQRADYRKPTGTDVFDGIIYAERVPNQWMNGSSGFAAQWRTTAGRLKPWWKAPVAGSWRSTCRRTLDKLLPGTNVLAIHGLNFSAGDPDMLILPELAGGVFTLQTNQIGYFDQPTPGAMNGAVFQRLFASLGFSHDRGFYAAPFSLSITSDVPDVTIRYTLNGSAPNETNGTTYATPIPVSRTTVVRAAAFQAGLSPTERPPTPMCSWPACCARPTPPRRARIGTRRWTRRWSTSPTKRGPSRRDWSTSPRSPS